jgi:cell division protease FtsH
MSDKLGPVTLGRKHHEVFLGRDIMEDRNYSEEIAFAIDQEVRRIIDECFEKVRGILTENFEKLEEITAILLDKEVLEGAEFNELLGLPEQEEKSVSSASTDVDVSELQKPTKVEDTLPDSPEGGASSDKKEEEKPQTTNGVKTGRAKKTSRTVKVAQ